MVSLGSLIFVCYFTNWAQYRNGQGKFTPENIDPFMCTHINYAFAELKNGVLSQYEWNDDSNYAKVIALKKQNPNLKIMLSVGGWSIGSAVFSDMISNVKSRSNFVTTSIAFLKKYGFDGLDIDWEYPGSREGSRRTDKPNFTKLLSELKTAFKPSGFLLTAAVGVGISTVANAYEISSIAKILDFINVMAYDFHGSWESFTGHHSPIYPRSNEKDEQVFLNIDMSIKYWLNNGTPKEKIVLGLGTYGRSFTLADPNKNSLGARTNGPGLQMRYTSSAGIAAYYEICSLGNGWTKVFDTEQKVPYIYKGNQWIGYDDESSIAEKAKYVLANGFGGVMFWSLDFDDFTGTFCKNGKYPLVNKVRSILMPNAPKPSTALTTKQVAKTTKPSNLNCLRGNGNYPLPGCSSFYRCAYVGSIFQSVIKYNCPPLLLFDSRINQCNWYYSVKCEV